MEKGGEIIMSYEQLEARMVPYAGLLTVPVIENQESLVVIKQAVIPNGYLSSMADMIPLLQDKIPVRESVYEKLMLAQAAVTTVSGGDLSLFVTYGYRSLEVQTRKFLEQLGRISGERFFSNPVDLYEKASRFIAVPTVAGHPTGGAVDLTLIYQSDGQFLDFGSTMYDFSNKDCYTFSPDISAIGKRNRAFLRTVMLDVGFAPYDGEWWHFCYGDREWAYYYQQPNAIYEQLPEERVKELVG